MGKPETMTYRIKITEENLILDFKLHEPHGMSWDLINDTDGLDNDYAKSIIMRMISYKLLFIDKNGNIRISETCADVK